MNWDHVKALCQESGIRRHTHEKWAGNLWHSLTAYRFPCSDIRLEVRMLWWTIFRTQNEGDTCKTMLSPPSGPKELQLMVIKRFISETDRPSNALTTGGSNRESLLQALILNIQSKGDTFEEKLHNVKIEKLQIYSAKKDPSFYQSLNINFLLNKGDWQP